MWQFHGSRTATSWSLIWSIHNGAIVYCELFDLATFLGAHRRTFTLRYSSEHISDMPTSKSRQHRQENFHVFTAT
jgi:hypothetical protein